MAVHIMDSAIFQGAWTTPEIRALFDDVAVVRGWIEVLVALAETEAEFGLIPAPAARRIAEGCRDVVLDEGFFAEVREDYAQTNHSLLGLIRTLQRRCPGDSGEWLCYGATVQDITDTHTARSLLQVHASLAGRLDGCIVTLGGLAHRHRDTPMAGRTHGQIGLPITFGFKAAGWLDECLRHRQRLVEIAPRLGIGQLAGGVGSLSSFGPEGLALQRRFLERLGLQAPAISWTAARDRHAEWLNLLALLAATADRIGHEVYNLQRPEIGELAEGALPGAVGSITMPQKRNPEIAEHLGTLARLVRHHAASMMENLVHDHERDGRAWKGEWALLPGACLATDKAMALLQGLLGHLEIHAQRMGENLAATQGAVLAERAMLALAPTLGKQSAHDLVYRVAMATTPQGTPLREALRADPAILAALGGAEAARIFLDRIFDAPLDSGHCAAMVDRVLVLALGLAPTGEPRPAAAAC